MNMLLLLTLLCGTLARGALGGDIGGVGLLTRPGIKIEDHGELGEHGHQAAEIPQGARPGGRFPYIVSIRARRTSQHICTGVLIAKKYVLTAAHCVDPTSSFSAGSRPVVFIGESTGQETVASQKAIPVANSILHENWNGELRSPYNAALLELSEESEQSSPQILADKDLLGTESKVSQLGFGSGGDSIALGSPIFGSLKEESAMFIDSQRCRMESLWDSSVEEELLCVLNELHRSSCTVDSGSPLMILDRPAIDKNGGDPSQDLLLGINVDGAPCGTEDKPDIFLDIQRLNNWIQCSTSEGLPQLCR